MKSRNLSRVWLAMLIVAALTFSLAVRAQARTETVLYNFSGGADGNEITR